MATAICPGCDGEVYVPRSKRGQRVTCPECGAELEVVSAQPLELDWVREDEEDEEEDE